MQPTMDKIVKTGNSCIFLTDNGGSHQLYNVETNTALNYEEVIPYGKYLIVKRDRLYGIIDYDFNILVKCKYDNIKELKEAGGDFFRRRDNIGNTETIVMDTSENSDVYQRANRTTVLYADVLQ